MDGTKYEVKKDCFAYNQMMNGCTALKRLYCKEENCKFYKTKKQLDDERKKYPNRYA